MKKNFILMICIISICIICVGCGNEIQSKETIFRQKMQTDKFEDTDMQYKELNVYRDVRFLKFDTEKFLKLTGCDERFAVSSKRNCYYCSNDIFDPADCHETTECHDDEVKKCIEKYIALLNKTGIGNISDKYEPVMVNSEKRIYYVRLLQQVDDIEISDLTHGDIYKKNRIEGTDIEIYFTLNELLFLSVENCVEINGDKKTENLCDKNKVIEGLLNTYGRIVSSSSIDVDDVRIKYTLVQNKVEEYMLIPTWIADLKISSEEGDYIISVIFNVINAKEIL